MTGRSPEETRILLYELLFQVLIEIREEAYYINNSKISRLSDLVHNLPLYLKKQDCDHNAVFEKLRSHANSVVADRWFDNAIKQL